MSSIVDAVRDVRSRIDAAAARAGRNGEDVALLAATKTVAPEDVLQAIEAGVSIVGENVAQELIAKQEAVGARQGLRWDFIGTLQKNKVNKVVGRVGLIHSVDSVALAAAIGRRSGSRPQDVLLELNASGEASKHGFHPDAAREAIPQIARIQGIRVVGAMTMAPAGDEAAARSCFARLAGLVREPWWPEGATQLSMGMSDDFEIAVEEGSTLVRVGSALFGSRCELGLGA